MRFGKLTAGILTAVMTVGMAYSGMSLSAKAIRQETPVHVTIDQRSVTPEEAKDGVLIYVRVDTPLLNTIIFSTHVDERCQYMAITDNDLISMISEGYPELSVQMVAQDSIEENNVTQYLLAQTMPSVSMATDSAFVCMNLVALYVKIPEEEIVPGAHFDIEYVSGIANITEAWRNSYSGEVKNPFYSVTFEAQDYMELGLLETQNGWIEITSERNEPTTEEITDPPTETPASYAKGDIDGDGAINIVDVLTLNQYLLGIGEILPERVNLGDVNNDGIVNDADAMTILKSLVGLAKIS